MASKATCAGCFRFDPGNEDGWVFWEMLGSKKGSPETRYGAWLCPSCAKEQKERRALRVKMKNAVR